MHSKVRKQKKINIKIIIAFVVIGLLAGFSLLMKSNQEIARGVPAEEKMLEISATLDHITYHRGTGSKASSARDTMYLYTIEGAKYNISVNVFRAVPTLNNNLEYLTSDALHGQPVHMLIDETAKYNDCFSVAELNIGSTTYFTYSEYQAIDIAAINDLKKTKWLYSLLFAAGGVLLGWFFGVAIRKYPY